MRTLAYCLGSLLLFCAAPAFADVAVTSPTNGSTVNSPITLTAIATPCSLQPVAAMGYSLDSSSSTATVSGASIAARVAATNGAHVLHVKSWGNQGAPCVTDVTITVVPTTVPSPSVTNVTISSPVNGASLTSPFSLSASGIQCSSQPISAMGYSLDSSASTTFVNGTTLSASVTAAIGAHTLHVKSWGNQGAGCDTDLAITVIAATVVAGPTIPANAVAIKAIQNLTTWQAAFDYGTGGAATSSGTMNLVSSPAVSGSSRQFITTYSNYGGERYNSRIGIDETSTNFVFDTYIYLASPINDIANIEMDLNQVIANGQTIIFGLQCDGWSRSWDFTANLGTPTNSNDQWIHSNATCNPQTWAVNTWHHVQASYSRDGSGNVTYKSVWLDGAQQDLNVTTASSFAIGWAPTLLVNFQVDGMTALPGTATIYLDNFTIYRW
jgi:hypothetical protein